jgi:hypothetical protein
MKTVVLLLATCLLLMASSFRNVVAEEEWPEDWEDEVEETTELANVSNGFHFMDGLGEVSQCHTCLCQTTNSQARFRKL